MEAIKLSALFHVCHRRRRGARAVSESAQPDEIDRDGQGQSEYPAVGWGQSATNPAGKVAAPHHPDTGGWDEGGGSDGGAWAFACSNRWP